MLEVKFLRSYSAISHRPRIGSSVHRQDGEGRSRELCGLACRLEGLPRRTFYYHSKRRQRRITNALAARVKSVIDTLPYAGYRTVAWLLGENKDTLQRIFQLKG